MATTNYFMPDKKYSKLFIALPVMNELHYLPALMHSIEQQEINDIELFVCVNQPEHWWTEDSGLEHCINNQETGCQENNVFHILRLLRIFL